MRNRIKELLHGVFHPELEQDIVTAGIFEGAEIEGEKVVVSLIFRKARDPFAVKIKSRVEQTIAAAYPDYKVVVVIKEGEKSAERAAKNAAIEEMHNFSTTAPNGKSEGLASTLIFLTPPTSIVLSPSKSAEKPLPVSSIFRISIALLPSLRTTISRTTFATLHFTAPNLINFSDIAIICELLFAFSSRESIATPFIINGYLHSFPFKSSETL